VRRNSVVGGAVGIGVIEGFSLVRQNTATGATRAGMLISGSSATIAEHNRFTANYIGIFVETTDRFRLEANVAARNEADGISLSGYCCPAEDGQVVGNRGVRERRRWDLR
jgi:hypothetical protein